MITSSCPTCVDVKLVFPSNPKSISDTIPLITANSLVKVNFLREQVISTKPNNANLEPLVPVRVICNLANLLLVFILSHKDFEMQL